MKANKFFNCLLRYSPPFIISTFFLIIWHCWYINLLRLNLGKHLVFSFVHFANRFVRIVEYSPIRLLETRLRINRVKSTGRIKYVRILISRCFTALHRCLCASRSKAVYSDELIPRFQSRLMCTIPATQARLRDPNRRPAASRLSIPLYSYIYYRLFSHIGWKKKSVDSTVSSRSSC